MSKTAKTYADLAVSDYDGTDLPLDARVRELLVQDRLLRWRSTERSAKLLINSDGLSVAVGKYIMAYDDCHQTEGSDDERTVS